MIWKKLELVKEYCRKHGISFHQPKADNCIMIPVENLRSHQLEVWKGLEESYKDDEGRTYTRFGPDNCFVFEISQKKE